MSNHDVLERDMLLRDTAGGPCPGSASSWRYLPRCTVTLQVWGAVLLIGLGLLLGLLLQAVARNALDQALQSRLHQADERRRLNEPRSTVRTTYQQRSNCPHCQSPSPECHLYFAPKIMEEQQDDN
jgi:hypothetical protein